MRQLLRCGAATAGGALLVSASVLCAQAAPARHATDAWPDALVRLDGTRVTSAKEFEQKRRPELLHLFAENVYGKTPTEALPMRSTVTSTDTHALGGLAVRKQIDLTFEGNGLSRTIHVLEYLPAQAKGPVPVFVSLNFDGNAMESGDRDVDLQQVWVADPEEAQVRLSTELKGHVRRRLTEADRGKNAGRWPLAAILHAGFGAATAYAGDFEPDFATGIGYGVRPLFFKEGAALPAADEWGTLGVWAWGLSRMADYLARDPAVNAKQMIVIGHSRMGKAALWAGAQDTRFALVISNESGQGGASLAHRQAAETIAHLNIAFPYWFCANYHHFTGAPDKLPVDGHLLLAAIAPRPVFVASAEDDPYSDPRGEFLAAAAASEVYALYGEKGLSAAEQVETGKPLGVQLRYYVRKGGHDETPEDWAQYLAWAREMLRTQ